jgi:redox-sensitive bicupin YhaK (pirin superfamily)
VANTEALRIRRANERGHAQHGWLESRHTFSFADYYDPRHMGFRTLRVINEDWVAPAKGFGTHPHRDMEILTVVLDGALAHQDSKGNGSVIRPDEVQRMSAGTGVTHSELNASKQEPVHLLQIWIVPERDGLPPGYEQRAFPAAERRGRLTLLASRDGRDGSVTVHQDARLWAAVLDPGTAVAHEVAPGRAAWVQVIRGELDVGGTPVEAGDGIAVERAGVLALAARAAAEVLVFDLA